MTASDGGASSVDVLVVGAGRAGLEAAAQAARGGETVLCVERGGESGGKLRTEAEAGDPGARRARDALCDAAIAAGARIVTSAAVFGLFPAGDGVVAAIYDPATGAVSAVRARRVVAATGTPALARAVAARSDAAAVPMDTIGSAARHAPPREAGARGLDGGTSDSGAPEEWFAATGDSASDGDRPGTPLFPVPIEALAAFADRARLAAGRPTLTLDVG